MLRNHPTPSWPQSTRQSNSEKGNESVVYMKNGRDYEHELAMNWDKRLMHGCTRADV